MSGTKVEVLLLTVVVHRTSPLIEPAHLLGPSVQQFLSNYSVGPCLLKRLGGLMRVSSRRKSAQCLA